MITVTTLHSLLRDSGVSIVMVTYILTRLTPRLVSSFSLLVRDCSSIKSETQNQNRFYRGTIGPCISIVDSFLEAARDTGVNEASMVWHAQVVRHADREANTVKELILSAGLVSYLSALRRLPLSLLRGY